MTGPRFLAAVPLLFVTAALSLAACGDEETGGDPIPLVPSVEQFAADANAVCSDGVQEAIALPLPQSAQSIAADAAARAEIVARTRDQITGIGTPTGGEDQLAAYLAELEADEEQLAELAESGEVGIALDESAGAAALELDLDECAALANAIARTP